MPLTKDQISALLPHTGDMCLLDGVQAWDDDGIVCSVSSHRDPANPLRCHGELPVIAGIEYAAQAMGVHGRLVTGNNQKPAAGFLASVRDLIWHARRIDDVPGPITVRARRLADNVDSVMCEFGIYAEGRPLLTGRATLLLEVK